MVVIGCPVIEREGAEGRTVVRPGSFQYCHRTSGGQSNKMGSPFSVDLSSKGVGLATAARTQHPLRAFRSTAATRSRSSGDSIS